MQESARKQRYYRKRYFRKNRITTKQCKSILRKDRESKKIYNTQLNRIL